MQKVKILSIDGGGIRGIIAVKILKEVERLCGGKIHDIFDLVAGTSTGGLIAAGLTLGKDGKPMYSLDEIEAVYRDHRATIFPPKNWIERNITSWFSPGYDVDGLESVLTNLLGEHRLSDCIKPVLISAYDIQNDSPVFFKTRHWIEEREENPTIEYTNSINARLFDVCRATSAGPTYFEPHKFTHYGKDKETRKKVPKEITCIDGGVFVNNPSLSAVAEILKHKIYYCGYGDIDIDNIYLLSIGTGSTSKSISLSSASTWGAINWVRPLIDIMMNGVNRATDYKTAQILRRNHYLRLDAELEAKFAQMDDASEATYNVWLDTADKIIKEQHDDLKRFVDAIC